jgi:hypothetical protein
MITCNYNASLQKRAYFVLYFVRRLLGLFDHLTKLHNFIQTVHLKYKLVILWISNRRVQEDR